ncbi:MAG: trigger factor [Candidatus Moraniibacteriota bacterium]
MDIVVKKLPKSMVEMTITLTWEDWSKHLSEAVGHISKEVRVEGFRKGKAPRRIIEQKVGTGMVLAEAAEHAIQHSYPLAVKEQGLDVIGHPDVKLGAVKEGEALTYTVVTAVMPEITLASWRDDVKSENAKRAEKTETVTAEEVTAELDRLAKMRSVSVAVDRVAENGDTLTIDFDVLVDGVPIEGGSAKDHAIVLGSGTFIPGFEEQLIGMKAGDEKKFDLPFPKEYHAKHLAGRPATFSVGVKKVSIEQKPELTDAFAVTVGNFKTIEELRKNIEEGIAEEKKMKAKESHRSALLDAIVAKTDIEFPAVLIEDEIRRMLAEFRSQVSMMGLDFADYLKHSKKTEDDLAKDWEPQAKKRLSASLILEKIAQDEGIEAESEAVEEEMNRALQYYRSTKDAEKKIDMEQLYRSAQGRLRNEAVFTMLESL